MHKKEIIIIPRKEHEEFLEEVGILHDSEMMAAMEESDEAKRKRIKTWKLKL